MRRRLPPALRTPLLISRFFASPDRSEALRVFLCGPRPIDRYRDLRKQLKGLLSMRMGCTAFLGEEIQGLPAKPTRERNYQTAEVQEALASDLLIILLASESTFAELGTFTGHPEILPRIRVLNDARHQADQSYINQGPLRMLSPDQVEWCAGLGEATLQVVRLIDKVVACCWFGRRRVSDMFRSPLGFEQAAVLGAIYASFPVTVQDLVELCAPGQICVAPAVAHLVSAGVVRQDGDVLLPDAPLDVFCRDAVFVHGAARTRMALLNQRLTDADNVALYKAYML